MRVGFIGLGLMGNPMARNISKKFPLAVYNRTFSKTKGFAKACKTPKNVADLSDVIITMVTGPKDVKRVLLGKNSVSKSKNKPIVVDMSTIGPKAAKEIAAKLKKQKIEFIDAPVTGSTPAAINGTLTIFAAGKKETFEKIKPVLESMGKNIHYCGQQGSGQAIKLVNNLLVGLGGIALSEAFILADKEGLSRKMVAEMMENAPVTSPYIRMKMHSIIKNDFKTLFSMDNMHKDIGLAITEMGKNALPMMKESEKQYRNAIKSGLGKKDFSAIIKYLKKRK